MSSKLQPIQKAIHSKPITVDLSSANEDHTQFFARISLHGLTKSSDGTPSPIDLERRLSFPMPIIKGRGVVMDEHSIDLSARSLSPIYDIEARVCFDQPTLGVGRAGIVYPLEILSFKYASSDNEHSVLSNDDDAAFEFEGPPKPPSLPPLCIKVAKPGYARNMAREAWFYEQLDKNGLTGLVAPRCYGVFHAAVPDGLTIDIPRFNYYRYASEPIYMEEEESYGTYTDCMIEERYDEDNNDLVFFGARLMDDAKKSYNESEWRLFRDTPKKITLTVLIMDMLGKCLTVEDFENDWEPDLQDIFDHLVPFDILHSDFRFPNVLRVPPHLQVPCPMHPHAIPGHKWHFTDWELAKVIRISPRHSRSTWSQRHYLEDEYLRAGGEKNIIFRDEFQGDLPVG